MVRCSNKNIFSYFIILGNNNNYDTVAYYLKDNYIYNY